LGKGKASSVREHHYTGKTPIPLPSFATAGRALGGSSGVQPGASQSSGSPKAKSKGSSLSRSKSMGAYNGSKPNDRLSMGASRDDEEEEEEEVQKRQGPWLSHAALALILERGRPITRMPLLPFALPRVTDNPFLSLCRSCPCDF
jgi:hypothetical protein